MDDRTATVLRVLAVQAAIVSAAIHLLEGLPKLAVYLPILSFADPRPYLFVPSALLLVGLATVIVRGARHRRLYSLSAGVLLAYTVGYAWWHLTDHGGLVPSHEVTNPVGEIAAHLATDPVAFVAFAAQVVGVVAFLALFVADPELPQHSTRDAGAAATSDTRADAADAASEHAGDRADE
ncbi:hypothetical protein HUG10_13150 [Halorarum halophilum]|uniref:Uncharacterized protein n=1 Tax=Halorarum halophilum TaxID=2743090 RepID=A0A7D5KGM7_9EURY|nr:hypothetical protein [Halobaculum halophilum]QLG28436.1 hypothetical protein HUG10_13150 [Halobaculum halophilum]